MRCFQSVIRTLLTSVLIFTLYNIKSVSPASCCGGGSSSSLLLPKMANHIFSVGTSFENYDGYWDKKGSYHDDPPDSHLSQIRIESGYGYRFFSNLQGSIIVPYVINLNKYHGLVSNSHGIGDTFLDFTYEFFDKITCVWQVRKWQDLMPATYLKAGASIPTGVSPFDFVKNSFDITGKGFYRLNAGRLIEKTIYPFSGSLQFTYGRHVRRPVNREYGIYVRPYYLWPGDRFQTNFSFAYTFFLDSMDSLSIGTGYQYLKEGDGEINKKKDETNSFFRHSFTVSVSYSTADRNYILRLNFVKTIADNYWGLNFPSTNTISMEVSYVLR